MRQHLWLWGRTPQLPGTRHSQRRWWGGLSAPTQADVDELFRRLGSQQGSILWSQGDPNAQEDQMGKYRNDWTVRHWLSVCDCGGCDGSRALLLATFWHQKQYRGKTTLVIKPASTQEVSLVLEHCYHRRIGVVPQGGNTGLVGGSVGVDQEVVLSLERLNHMEGPSLHHGILQAGAGCILQDLQDFCQSKGRLLPLDLGAKGTCQIGGNLSTNAGGSYFYRYGSLHATVLGLEVVLADGRILSLGYHPLAHPKDNTGYDLKHLFVGAEGTLGVITGVALACPSRPSSKAAAFLACQTYEQVHRTLMVAHQELGEILAAYEFMDAAVLGLVQQEHSHLSVPLASSHQGGLYPYSVLVETHGSNEVHDQEKMEAFLERVLQEDLVDDGVLSQNLSQLEDFWKVREACNPSVASQGYVYKYDVSLPIPDFEAFAREVQTALEARLKRDRTLLVTNWGHVVDGNLHLNVVVPGAFEKDPNLYQTIEEVVLQEVLDRKGSISAEHGLGQYKHIHLPRIKDPSTLDTMRSLKALLDPHGILNPGKYLPPP